MLEVDAEARAWARVYDLHRARTYYERSGLLTKGQFGQAVENALKIRNLGIPELKWLLFDHLLSVYRSLPLLAHYKAAASGVGQPFSGIEALYQYFIKEGLLPAWTLNRTTCYQLPKGRARIGELLVSAGLASPAAVDRSLEIQRTVREETGINVAVGQVFRSVGYISVVDFFQILGLQCGIPFESLDESAAKIFHAAMAR